MTTTKKIGFVGITNIPLYEVECDICKKLFNTSNPKDVNHCLECRPFKNILSGRSD